MKVGNGLDEGVTQGPLINAAAVAKVEEHIADAASKGARVMVGGGRHSLGGSYFEPTVMTDVNPQMLVARDETFGPLAPLFRFEGEEEAIALANDTKYGLAAGLFTRDLGTAMRLTRALRAGIQYVNCYRLGAPMARIGGFGDSGKSREGGLDAIYEYTKPVNVWINTTV